MREGFRVRRAQMPDIAEITAILQGRRRWLCETKRSDQWASVGEWRQLLMYLIRHGNVWVLVTDDDDGWIVGTVTVGTDPDLDFWQWEEQRPPALYLSKLATAVELKGQDLGGVMLDWAVDRAPGLGFGRVRLDAWKTSTDLQAYYVDHGWTTLGIVDLEHRQSGALFERRSSPRISIAATAPRRVALVAR